MQNLKVILLVLFMFNVCFPTWAGEIGVVNDTTEIRVYRFPRVGERRHIVNRGDSVELLSLDTIASNDSTLWIKVKHGKMRGYTMAKHIQWVGIYGDEPMEPGVTFTEKLKDIVYHPYDYSTRVLSFFWNRWWYFGKIIAIAIALFLISLVLTVVIFAFMGLMISIVPAVIAYFVFGSFDAAVITCLIIVAVFALFGFLSHLRNPGAHMALTASGIAGAALGVASDTIDDSLQPKPKCGECSCCVRDNDGNGYYCIKHNRAVSPSDDQCNNS